MVILQGHWVVEGRLPRVLSEGQILFRAWAEASSSRAAEDEEGGGSEEEE